MSRWSAIGTWRTITSLRPMSATNPKRTYRSIVNLMLSAAPRAHSSVSDLDAPLNEERLSGPAEGSSLDVERVGPRAICQEK